MNETTKTAIYGGVALLAALIAAFSIPLERNTAVVVEDERFEKNNMFPKLESAEVVQGLRIVQPDDKGGPAKSFRVNQQQGRWVIATRNNYPADLKDQIRNAATALVGLKPLPQVATEQASEHGQFGVEEPKEGQSSGSEKATGTLVELLDAKDNPLASLIIGKAVKGSPEQRFVRVPGEPRVYTAKVSPDRFSTKFEDWIEKNLLNLRSDDVERIVVKDYVPELAVGEDGQPRAMVVPRAEITLKKADFKWMLDKLTVYRDGRPSAGKLLENEEINGQRIDEMTAAMAALEIVEVSRKPKALAAYFRGTQQPLDQESQVSLAQNGFAVLDGEGGIALLSVNGVVEADTKDGVQYLLRFGNISGTQQGAASDKLNRFLMVSASLYEPAFPAPQLRPVPELPAGPAAENKPEEKTDAAKDPAAKEEAKKADPTADKTAELEADRDLIIKSNQRLTNEHKEKKLKAEQRVAELNDRFADWYFVVSEDGFKKVRFSLQDIVKEKDEGYLLDAFRKLEKEGLKKPKAEAPGAGGPGFPGGFNFQP